MKSCLVAFDSDGCVFDAMEPKHKLCFGPAAVSVYGLQDMEEEFLSTWNHVNLYSGTRGINRFLGLILVFDIMAEKGYNITRQESLRQWSQRAEALSAAQLKQDGERTQDQDLLKAARWSMEVNALIDQKVSHPLPFRHAKAVITAIAQKASIAVVSSANTDAIRREWAEHGMLEFVTAFFGQEAGSKSHCLGLLKEQGYKKILMVGDAPGDQKAAEDNGCQFHLIEPGNEDQAWLKLRDQVVVDFLK